MRAKHTLHRLPAFPVYSAGFISDNELVLGGGGGSSRAGIKNKLKLFRLGGDVSIELLDEFELEQDADAPMSMAVHHDSKSFVCGINSATVALEKGENENCRLYNTKDNKIEPGVTRGTLTAGNVEDYQRVSAISPSGKLLVVAGAQDFSLLQYPSLVLATPPVKIEKGEIYDATFSSDKLVIVTTLGLLFYALPEDISLEQDLRLLKNVDIPSIPGAEGNGVFRAARFHPTESNVIYSILNITLAAPPRTSTRSRMPPKHAYILKQDVDTWAKPKTRKISDRALTCFDISPDGKYLGFGSSDYTVGLLDSKTLAPVLTVLKAHDFPPTALRFNPGSNLLVSGSPDNSIRVISIPTILGGQSWNFFLTILVTLFILLLAFAVQGGYIGSRA